jgi:restriction system protein
MVKRKTAEKKSAAKKTQNAAKKAKVQTARCRGNSGRRRRKVGSRQGERTVVQGDEAASALRSRYVDQLANEFPSGSLNVEKVREALIGAEGICKSIAKEKNPTNREGMMRAMQAAFLGAVEIESGNRRAMELLGSYIRERVSIGGFGTQPAAPPETAHSVTRTAKHPRDSAAPRESKTLFDLRAHVLDRIMEVQRPGPCQQRDDAHSFLISLDRTCDSMLRYEAPWQREALLRATQAAFQSIIELDPSSQAFIDLLTSYVRERVTIEIQNEPAFLDGAPRIAIRSLIIPGDRTREGTLVKAVGTLWFEILRQIKNEPDSIHRIDCWKLEELIAGAYKQEGWEIVVLTPKRGDKGRDVIAQRKDWGQLRFHLLDQVKAYSPDHLVGPDEIREMAGVLHRECGATKGLITTTSSFTSGAEEEARYLFPRLELKPRDKLLAWLASVATEEFSNSGKDNSRTIPRVDGTSGGT